MECRRKSDCCRVEVNQAILTCWGYYQILNIGVSLSLWQEHNNVHSMKLNRLCCSYIKLKLKAIKHVLKCTHSHCQANNRINQQIIVDKIQPWNNFLLPFRRFIRIKCSDYIVHLLCLKISMHKHKISAL